MKIMRPVAIAAYLILLIPVADSWWVPGSHVILDPRVTCRRSRRLRGKLAQICRNETGIVKEIARGVSLAASECQYQFQNRRWNCTLQRRSLKRILMMDTRETSFINAISAAGVVFSITRACTTGELVECSCERGTPSKLKHLPQPQTAPNEEWEWGGCSDNVHFGLRKSRQFMESRYRRRSDMKTLMKLHNHNAGRMALKNFMRLECKCHGLSGSCTLRTCWLKMPHFRDVGNRLKDKFDGATKVMASNKGDTIIPVQPHLKRPGKIDLVYSAESPDFCEADPRSGSLGTQGRFCNVTSPDIEGCDLLCCGRGFKERVVLEKVNCRCRFKWCCSVTCDTCIQNRTINSCL